MYIRAERDFHKETPVERTNKAEIRQVLTGSPSHGGDVQIYVKDINKQSLPTAFYSLLVSISIFMLSPHAHLHMVGMF